MLAYKYLHTKIIVGPMKTISEYLHSTRLINSHSNKLQSLITISIPTGTPYEDSKQVLFILGKHTPTTIFTHNTNMHTHMNGNIFIKYCFAPGT